MLTPTQVCLQPGQKEDLHLADYLKSAAEVMVKHLRDASHSGSDLPETQVRRHVFGPIACCCVRVCGVKCVHTCLVNAHRAYITT